MSRRLVFGLVALSLWLAPLVAEAGITFEDDAPRVFAIEPRPFRLGHEFQLGLGVLPLDAFYVGAVVSGSYTYHFSDFWAWEIAGGGYSVNFDTGLKGKLLRRYGVAPVRNAEEQIYGFLTTSAVVKPLFGKLTLFNRDVVYAETFFNVGIGAVRRGVVDPAGAGDYWTMAANLGIGFRFWSSRALSWRFDVRDYLVFKDIVPTNTLMLSFSAALNYYDRPEAS